MKSEVEKALETLQQETEYFERPTLPKNLIYDDGEPLESNRHRIAMNVLIRSLQQAWTDRNLQQILYLLQLRFGEVPTEVAQSLQKRNFNQLKDLLKFAFTTDSIEQFTSYLSSD